MTTMTESLPPRSSHSPEGRQALNNKTLSGAGKCQEEHESGVRAQRWVDGNYFIGAQGRPAVQVTFDQTPEGGENVNCAKLWWNKQHPSSGTSKEKIGDEDELGVLKSRICGKGGRRGGEAVEVRAPDQRSLVGHGEEFPFYSKCYKKGTGRKGRQSNLDSTNVEIQRNIGL